MGGAAHPSVVIIVSLAGILVGFDTAVIAGITHALREIFSLTPIALGAAVSSALWGTLLGALAAGRPEERFGCREMLRLIGLLPVISMQGSALAWNLYSFIVRRFLAGVAIGASSLLAPGDVSRADCAGASA